MYHDFFDGDYGCKLFIPFRKQEYSRNEILRTVCMHVIDQFDALGRISSNKTNFFEWTAALSSTEYVNHFRGANRGKFDDKSESVRSITSIRGLFNKGVSVDRYPNAVCVFQEDDTAYDKELNSHLSTMGSSTNTQSRIVWGAENVYYNNDLQKLALSTNMINYRTNCGIRFQFQNLDDCNMFYSFLINRMNIYNNAQYFPEQSNMNFLIDPGYSDIIADMYQIRETDKVEKLRQLTRYLKEDSPFTKEHGNNLMQSPNYPEYLQLSVPYGWPMRHSSRNLEATYKISGDVKIDRHVGDRNRSAVKSVIEVTLEIVYQMPTNAYLYVSPNRLRTIYNSAGTRMDRVVKHIYKQTHSSAYETNHLKYGRPVKTIAGGVSYYTDDLAVSESTERINIMDIVEASKGDYEDMSELLIFLYNNLEWKQLEHCFDFRLYESGFLVDPEYYRKDLGDGILEYTDLDPMLPYYCELYISIPEIGHLAKVLSDKVKKEKMFVKR